MSPPNRTKLLADDDATAAANVLSPPGQAPLLLRDATGDDGDLTHSPTTTTQTRRRRRRNTTGSASSTSARQDGRKRGRTGNPAPRVILKPPPAAAAATAATTTTAAMDASQEDDEDKGEINLPGGYSSNTSSKHDPVAGTRDSFSLDRKKGPETTTATTSITTLAAKDATSLGTIPTGRRDIPRKPATPVPPPPSPPSAAAAAAAASTDSDSGHDMKDSPTLPRIRDDNVDAAIADVAASESVDDGASTATSTASSSAATTDSDSDGDMHTTHARAPRMQLRTPRACTYTGRINPYIEDPIARIRARAAAAAAAPTSNDSDDHDDEDNGRELDIIGLGRHGPIDRVSWEYMVEFLDNYNRSSNNISNANTPQKPCCSSMMMPTTELALSYVSLKSDPPDGGLQVLLAFFARSDTTLTKVTLQDIGFIPRQDALRLLAAFQTNRTVTDLTIIGASLPKHKYDVLDDGSRAALGAILHGWIQEMPQLQVLHCTDSPLRAIGVRAFQPALQANRTITELNLSDCEIGDDGVSLIADALVGNQVMQVLRLADNGITSLGLGDITRMIESTRLKTIDLGKNRDIFNDEACTRRFAGILSRLEFLKELCISKCNLGDQGLRCIADSLVGSATVMDILDISDNGFSSEGLAVITRLIEGTKLKTIRFDSNRLVFHDFSSTRLLVSTLQHKESTVQEITGIYPSDFHLCGGESTHASFQNSLTRNRQLNRLDSLLVQPTQEQQPNPHTTALLMYKTWHKAITKFSMVPNHAGASAIFKLLTVRPQLLEKRLAAAAARPPNKACTDSKRNGNHVRNQESTGPTPAATTNATDMDTTDDNASRNGNGRILNPAPPSQPRVIGENPTL